MTAIEIAPDVQAILCRRRHQPRSPPLAKIRPGSPAPGMGPGTLDGLSAAPLGADTSQQTLLTTPHA